MKSLFNFLLVAALPAVMVACGEASETDVPAEVGSQTLEQAAAVGKSAEDIDVNTSEENESVLAETEAVAREPLPSEEAESVAATTYEDAAESSNETVSVVPETKQGTDPIGGSPDPEADAVVEETVVEAVAEEFTATTGLGDFSAYRMNFSTDFDGFRGGQPTKGTLDGLIEITRNPAAQHWTINIDGNAFKELALLGGGTEMYDVGDTIYIENPADGSFIGIPAMFVEGMVPSEMYSPEDNIEMPARAVLHSGEEIVNGITTQRYTFDRDDLVGENAKFENVDGAIWVAVDGNYVVKYEAVVTGKFDNLSAGNMKVLDEGTITMAYDISDVNGEFTINPPAGAKAINLTELLFN